MLVHQRVTTKQRDVTRQKKNYALQEMGLKQMFVVSITTIWLFNSSPWKIPTRNGGINAGKIIYFYGASIPWLC